MSPGPMHQYPSGQADWRAHGLAGVGFGERRKWLLRLLIVAALALFVGLIGVVILLSMRTVPLQTLSPLVEARLERALGPGYDVSIGAATIGLSRGDLIVDLYELELSAVEVGVVEVPVASITIDGGALVRGELRPAAILLDRPAATMLPAIDLLLSGIQRAAATPPELEFERLMAAADRAIADHIDHVRQDGLERIAVVNGVVNIAGGHPQGRRFTGIDADVQFAPREGGVRAYLSLFGQAGRGTVTFNRQRSPDGQVSNVIGVSDLSPTDFMHLAGLDPGRLQADMPLYGTFTLVVDAAGAIGQAELSMDVGAGIIESGDAQAILDEANLGLVWRADKRALVLDHLRFFFGETRADLTGAVRFGAGGAGDVDFAFYGRELILAPMAKDDPPLRLTRTMFSGRYDWRRDYLSFDEIAIAGDNVEISGAGNVEGLFSDPSIAIAIEAAPMPVETLKLIWPPLLAPGARSWIYQNLTAGRVARLEIDYAAPPLSSIPPGATGHDFLEGRFGVEDTVFRTFGELPPIRGADASGLLRGTRFDVEVGAGHIILPSSRRLDFGGGTLHVPNVFAEAPDGAINVALSGSAAALTELADAEPLAVARNNALDPGSLSGRADARVRVDMPLLADTTLEDVAYRVSVDLEDFASRVPIDGRNIAGGSLAVVVDNRDTRITGSAQIDGVPAELDIVRPTAGGGGTSTAVTAVLRAGEREKLGIDLGEILSGPVSVEIADGDGADGKRRLITADLTQSTLRLPQMSWSKPVGRQAMARFELIDVENGYRVKDFELTGKDFRIAGDVRIGDDGGIVSADFSEFALRSGDSARLTLDRADDGVMKMALTGKRLRIEDFVTARGGSGASSSSFENVDLDIELETAVGASGQEFRNLRLSTAMRGDAITTFALDGRIGANRRIVGKIENHGGQRRLVVRSNDGGAVLRFLDIYGRAETGDLSILIDLPLASGTIAGSITMTDFRIVNEAGLQRIAASGEALKNVREERSAVEPPAGAETSDFVMDKLVVLFRRTGGVLHLSKALLTSAVLGSSVTGSIDYDRDRVALKGTYVPAYLLNNLFSKVPLLGIVLGGGRDEGLFAVTFSITGPASAPVLKISPVSAIAPGVLRKAFEFQ